jgi:SAM-dependent methyltransferase
VPNPSLVRREKGLVRHTAHQLLHLDVVRFGVALARYVWFAKIWRRLKTARGQGAAVNTVAHNLKGLRDLAVNRSLYLTRPLSTIESLPPHADLLVIGPRTEGELLALVAHGFERRSIRALDLITYSPWVDLGDMHAMPYPDNSFDAVILGWVLAYSEDRQRAAKEVLRVLRPGGIVAIGVEWEPRSNDELEADLGYLPGSSDRIKGADEILAYFGTAPNEVLVRQEPDRTQLGSVIVIFSIRLDA